MKHFIDLDLGFSDAENYKKRKNKALFNRVFLKTKDLEKLASDDIYFIVGEKGTGKTAYAVFLANNEYKKIATNKKISGNLKYIRETDYQKFVELKKQNDLKLSDFTSIWRTILLLLMAKKIKEDESGGLIFRKPAFKLIQQAIDEYFKNAFAPEIITGLEVTEKSKAFAEILNKFCKAGGEDERIYKFETKQFQVNLHYIEQKLKDAISSVKTSKRHTLFIDGIDIRPGNIPYNEYLTCIKGLANAVWALNNDVFGAIKDPGGQCRVVLLIRPDILESIGLQNTNTKLRDNSLVLNWETTYSNYHHSNIFSAVDQLLAAQQSDCHDVGFCWEHYFPFNSPTEKDRFHSNQYSSFISFLRFSYFRPRDIIVQMEILQKLKNDSITNVTFSDFQNPEFRKRYSEYLLAEIKDQISFYHTKEEYEIFLKFFEYLDGEHRFNYKKFIEAYDNLISFLGESKMKVPKFFDSANGFLQYLFNLNVICYIELMGDNNNHIHWCYKERSYADISPKVKAHKRYELHYGLIKALNLGKKIRR